MDNQYEPIDLKPFLRTMGGIVSRGALDVPERELPEMPAELLDSTSSKVTASPLLPALFIDGTQSASVVQYRAHRPVTITASSAAAVNHDMRPVAIKENLEVVCAAEDVEWVIEAGCPVPVRAVTEETEPVLVERAIANDLKKTRDYQEIQLATDLLEETGADTWIFVDGHLANRPTSNRLAGVVKTTETRLLTDESVLWSLPEGWRSPRFIMPENHGGPSGQRYSCYVRMRNASNKPWSFGLIRVESFDPDALDSIAATALAFRQPAGTLDARGDRHIAPVAYAEKWMRSRRSIYL